MMIDWDTTPAAIWRKRLNGLRAVHELGRIQLNQLIGIEAQKQKLVGNTERFLKGLPANNVLLWGARGCGKSALIRALLNEYISQGLRVIELEKSTLSELPDIVDDLRGLPQKFIIFTDDLSFNQQDDEYRALKSVLDGSIEVAPENIVIYATSNRRHLIPEHLKDNASVDVSSGELHYGDVIEEKISLADRFGLWLSFYPITLKEYFDIVDAYLPKFDGDREALHLEARRFAMNKGSQNGRTAWQFCMCYKTL